MRYYDNSRLSDYKNCPRYYYMRHVRHWRSEGISLPLAFGLSWHNAMDIVWTLADSDRTDLEIAEVAIIKFIETWKEEGLPHPMPIESLDAKHRGPGIAHEMLFNYITLRRQQICSMKIIAVEHPFAVRLSLEDADLYYIGRMDKKAEQGGRVRGIEHKTTSDYAVKGGIQPRFIEGFSNNSQIDGYVHSLHMEHGDAAKEVWVDAALVHKQHHDIFRIIPVERQFQMLSSWQYDTLEWINSVESDKRRLLTIRDVGDHKDHLAAFRKNTNKCTDMYGKCSYFDLCRFQANPEKWGEPPEGFIEEKWEPFNILKIAELGLEPEEVL